MNKAVIIILLILLFSVVGISRNINSINPILKSPVNPFIWRKDDRGEPHFGANRGTRTHRGIDGETVKFQSVFSPLSGLITKIGTVYKDTSKYKYIEITGENELSNIKVRLHYVSILGWIKKGSYVSVGEEIGQMQDVSEKHNAPEKAVMLPHIHIEVIENGVYVNPVPFFGFNDNYV